MSDYKELPCRRCGRVWKWASDKKSVPYCPEGYGCTVEGPTTRELFDEVMKRLDDIDMKINRIASVQPVYPTYLGSPNTCSKCGMRWEGVMSYYCSNPGCPVQMQVTSQDSTFTGDFNIESLDPDQRTWYYDGDGTKRRKE